MLIRSGIDLAIAEIHNQIATCPDVELYGSDLDELEIEREQYRKLAQRIDAKLSVETTKEPK